MPQCDLYKHLWRAAPACRNQSDFYMKCNTRLKCVYCFRPQDERGEIGSVTWKLYLS